MDSVLQQPAVQSYIVYSGILALKLFVVTLWTIKTRNGKNIFANPEDIKGRNNAKVKYVVPDVERVRRAHLNDLENIPAFWVLGALYLTTHPSAGLATNLFRIFTAGRIIHTFVYAVKPLPQPSRALGFVLPFIICWYMGIMVVLHYSSAL